MDIIKKNLEKFITVEPMTNNMPLWKRFLTGR